MTQRGLAVLYGGLLLALGVAFRGPRHELLTNWEWSLVWSTMLRLGTLIPYWDDDRQRLRELWWER